MARFSHYYTFFAFFLHIVLILMSCKSKAEEKLKNPPLPPPALFIFGDSLVDVGNNNYINTTTLDQANFWPYGETYFKFPTGRFSDGRLVTDFIAGALVETFQGDVIDLETQLSYYKKVGSWLRDNLGDDESKMRLSKAVYFFSIGSNDYLSPFLTNSTAFKSYSDSKYVGIVIGNLTTEIYVLGGRKFAFLNVPRLGCLPGIRILKPDNNGSCLDGISSLATLHNRVLSKVLSRLEKQLNGFKFSLFDLHSFLQQRMKHPSKYGFKEGESACCGTGQFRGVFSCGGKRIVKEFELCEKPEEFIHYLMPEIITTCKMLLAQQTSGHMEKPSLSILLEDLLMVESFLILLVVNLKTQLSYFRDVEKQLRQKIGDADTKLLLSKAIYLFSVGSNDYIVPFTTNSTVLQLYSQKEYVGMEIHKVGGKKFGFVNVGPLGCLPFMKALKQLTSGCFQELTVLEKLHNKELSKILKDLQRQLEGFQGRERGMLWNRSLQRNPQLRWKEADKRVPVVNLQTQLSYFRDVEKQVRKEIGDAETKLLLSKAIYLFSIGINDYVIPLTTNSTVFQSYSEKEYLGMEIYKVGGRKFGFVNTPPMGCTPYMKALKQLSSGCFEAITALEKLHNRELSKLLKDLQGKLEGFGYTNFDVYKSLRERINHPSKHGFKEGKEACCGTGPYRGIIPSCGWTKDFQLCHNASEYKMEPSWLNSYAFLLCLSMLIAVTSCHSHLSPSDNHVPLFVFGGSQFDAGNNKYLKNVPQGPNYFWPYGETFFKHPAGRFSDGRIIPDFIGKILILFSQVFSLPLMRPWTEYLKLPLIPPYLQPDNHQFTNGVNFASGGGGALVETHRGMLSYFKEVVNQLKKKLGNEETEILLSKAIYLFSSGSSDYVATFTANSCSMMRSYTEKEYVGMVIGNITTVIKEMYKIGARKFGFVNLPLWDTIPLMKAFKQTSNGTGSCMDEVEVLVKLHNKAFPEALKELQMQQLKELKYS
ncbi:hypothetical protein Tsubulata_028095, partial [Turnera subulata]